jgi:polyhydroxyalkanoate synthesis regulator phasin
MTTIETARTRAEELLQNLQKKAKDLIEAEDGVVKTVRALVEEKGLAPHEVQKKLEELVGRIKANKVWDRVKASNTLATFNDYRGEMQHKMDDTVQRIMHSLSVASTNEVADLTKQVTALNRKVNELTKKLDTQN